MCGVAVSELFSKINGRKVVTRSTSRVLLSIGRDKSGE